jgi:hypothetical protein
MTDKQDKTEDELDVENTRLEAEIRYLEKQVEEAAYLVAIEAANLTRLTPALVRHPLEVIAGNPVSVNPRQFNTAPQNKKIASTNNSLVVALLRHFVSYDLYAFDISGEQSMDVLERAAVHSSIPAADVRVLLGELETNKIVRGFLGVHEKVVDDPGDFGVWFRQRHPTKEKTSVSFVEFCQFCRACSNLTGFPEQFPP